MVNFNRIKKWAAWVIAGMLSASALAVEQPNILFIMLDDFGYSQLEAYSRGLTAEDCDPKLLELVGKHAKYTPEQAFEQMRKASPTLSRMADQGVRFNNAFASSNLCAPARMGVATGILQNRWGVYRNIDAEGHGLKPHSHLAERIRESGYATAHIGKWHIGSRDRDMAVRYLKKGGIANPGHVSLGSLFKNYPEIMRALNDDGYMGSVAPKDHPLNHGFDYYFGYNMWECIFYNARNVWENFDHAGVIKDYNTDVFTDKALAFMEKSLASKKPFYVQLHYHTAHHPLKPKAPENYLNRFNSGVYTIDNFYAHIFAVDEGIRRIEEFLRERGEHDNTIFVFTSDNGGSIGGGSPLPGNAPFSGHKGMLNLGGFRVPLFFYWPEGIKGPLEKNQLVSTLDILPTLVDAVGGTLPTDLDGKSLLPWMLEGKDGRVRNNLAIGGIHARVWGFNGHTSFFSHNRSREKAPSGYFVADDRYILRFVSETIPDLYKDVPGGIPAHYELYDYTMDPGEQNNIADQFPEKVDQLRKVWKRESAGYPKPVKWDKEKWEAMQGG
jgi:uncharacterized sulfatase